jgi:hypothetical protein
MIPRERDDDVPARILDPNRGDARWPMQCEIEAAQDDVAQLLTWSRSAAEADDRRDLIAEIVHCLPPTVRRAEKIAAWRGARAVPTQFPSDATSNEQLNSNPRTS